MSDLNQKIGSLLIVDDEPTDAMLLQKALKTHVTDHQIDIASSGYKALEYLKRFEFQPVVSQPQIPLLILLDLNMPGISGFEVIDKLKTTARLKGIPVIVFTSSRDKKDVVRAFDKGANSYLVKPNSFTELSTLAGNIVKYWLTLDRNYTACNS